MSRLRIVEQAMNAFHEIPSRYSQSRFAGPAVRFQCRKRDRIVEGVAAHRHDEVIATILAFRADYAGDPPDRGMIEQQVLRDRLEQIYQVIAAADVGELVE